MTTLTLRYSRGHFVVIGPDIDPHKFKSCRKARPVCMEHYPGSSIKEIGADATRQAAKAKPVWRAK
jgi:hypothetical protein